MSAVASSLIVNVASTVKHPASSALVTESAIAVPAVFFVRRDIYASYSHQGEPKRDRYPMRYS